MPVAFVEISDGQERIDAVVQRFSNPNQQACGEGHPLLAGFLDGSQALGRDLVGSIVMRPSRSHKV